MKEVDRRTTERDGVPSLTLMENAGRSVADFIRETFPNIKRRKIVVLCGKGNNGGDGLVVARQLHTRIKPEWLRVVLGADPAEMRGDALENYKMLKAVGCYMWPKVTEEMRTATLVGLLLAV